MPTVIKLVCFFLFFLVSLASAQEMLQRITLEPHAAARSQPITLIRNSVLRVEPVQRGEINPAIFVYRIGQGLVAKNDEDADRDAFEWSPARSVRVQVVLYSRTNQTVEYEIKRFRPEATRGPDETSPVLAVVRVFFATNRRLDSTSPVRLGGDPTEHNQLHLGEIKIRVPLSHRRGNIEYPSVWRLEFHLDASKHFVAEPAVLLDGARFYQDIADLTSRSDEHDALLFVHGYNTTFDESALRVAQLACDLQFKGPALLFSWPSQGQLLDYWKDTRNAELSAGPLSQFLRALAEQAHVARIHVIAHSMGNRVLASALTKVDSTHSNIRQIALMAPDFDAALFEELAREFPKNIGPIALYASSKDKALIASSRLAGYMRLGQAGKAISAIPGVEFIDASTVDTSILGLGHDYYASSGKILEDLFSFFQGLPPARRFALRPSMDGHYWVLIP